MAQKKWKLETLYAAQETTFNTDPDATGAAYKFLKSLGTSFAPSVDVIERPAMTNDLTRQPHAVGAKGGKLSFKAEMKASGTPAAAVPAVASETSDLLEACLGSVVRGTGTTIGGTPGTAAVPKVTSAAGLSKYMMLHFANGLGPGGQGEVRFIKSISGVDITLDRALSAVPVAAQVVTASSTFKRATAGHKSVAFVGVRDGIEYTFLGCIVSAKLDAVTPRGTAILSFEVDVASWSVTTKSASALPASSATTLAGVNAVRAPVVKGSPFALAAVERPILSVEFDPAQAFQYVETTTDVDNKGGFELVDAKPKGSFTSYYNSDQLSDYAAGTSKEVAFSCGTPSTGGWGIYIPGAQYTGWAQQQVNGLVAEKLDFAVNDNGADVEYVLSQF